MAATRPRPRRHVVNKARCRATRVKTQPVAAGKATQLQLEEAASLRWIAISSQKREPGCGNQLEATRRQARPSMQ